MAPLLGVIQLEFRREFLALENYSRWAMLWRCLCDLILSHLCKTPTCERRTDRQTDTQ